MNANLKLVVGAAISILLAAGCVSEQERRERAAREKVLQEQARKRWEQAEKERAERKAERVKTAIEAYWTWIYENNSRLIIHGSDDGGDELRQMLKNWVSSRFNLTTEEQERGNALLEEFGSKYMPNAYASYEKARERAQEMQQMFNENFPEALPPAEKDARYIPYCKVIKGLAKVRGIYFRKRDELCHFYLMHKANAISAAELAKVDGSPICIWLLEEMPFGRMPLARFTMSTKGRDKVVEFAQKRTPETYSVLKRIQEEWEETVTLYTELVNESRLMDAVRFELSVIACCEKANYIVMMLGTYIDMKLQTLQVEYATMEKDAEAIAKWDHENALKLTKFAEMMPSYVADRTKGPLIAANSKMSEFFPCDDIRLWHLHATGCLGNGPGISRAGRTHTEAGGSYQYWRRRYTGTDEMILKHETPIWTDAFARVGNRRECYLRWGTFSTTVDSPDMSRLFSGMYTVKLKVGFAHYDRRADKTLLDMAESPFLERLNELDEDKAHYSLSVKWDFYDEPESAKVVISN